MTKLSMTLLGAALAATVATSAHANIYNNVFGVSVIEALTPNGGFDAQAYSGFCNGATPAASNVACATFTLASPLNFANQASQNQTSAGDLNSQFGFTTSNVQNYAGGGTVVSGGTKVADFSTLNGTTSNPMGFLQSSGSIAGYAYGSLYTVTLGQLSVGTELTITHDDGVSLAGGSYSGTLMAGPTGAITQTVTITQAGSYTLYYARENGTPSVLQVSVPEPVSMSVLGAGLVGLGLMRRRARKA